MSGNDIMTLTHRRLHVLTGSGSIYSLLQRMERDGLSTRTWQQRRRVYDLTLKGAEVAEASQRFYQDFMDLSILNLSGRR